MKYSIGDKVKVSLPWRKGVTGKIIIYFEGINEMNFYCVELDKHVFGYGVFEWCQEKYLRLK